MYKRVQQDWKKHLDFILIDVLSLYLAFFVAYLIRYGGEYSSYTFSLYSGLMVVMTLLDVSVAALFNSMHNVMSRGIYKELEDTVKHALLVFGGLVIYMFSLKESQIYSRIVLYLLLLFHIFFGYCLRMLWKRILRRRDVIQSVRSMLVVVDEKNAEMVLDRLLKYNNETYSVSGVILIDGDSRSIKGIPVVAGLADAANYICHEWVDDVFFASGFHYADVQKLCDDCRTMGVVVHEALQLQNERGNRQFVEKVGGYQVLTSSINYATPMQSAMKRALDILGGLVGVILAGLIVLIVGPKIKKESPGPIFFSQERIGQNGKRFRIYKIRSMYLDAEERKKELMKQNRVADGMMFKMDFDPRIIGNEILPDGTKKTGIGDFIRRTSLDEFPQFLNVLRGEMSLVGTRPPTVDEWEKYEFHHRARLAFKPGITGMWQVSGRSEILDFEEVVKLDTYYINNWTMGLDFRILFQTVKAVIKKDGAM